MQPAGADRASLPQVLVQELEQYQVGEPRPCSRVPPRRPRPPGRGGHSDAFSCLCLSLQLLPKRLDWEGNEHSRSYEELVSSAPRPPRARAPQVGSLRSAPVRVPRSGECRGWGVIHGGPAARGDGPSRPHPPRARGGVLGGEFVRKRSWGRRAAQAALPLARGPAGSPGAAASHSEGRSRRPPF